MTNYVACARGGGAFSVPNGNTTRIHTQAETQEIADLFMSHGQTGCDTTRAYGYASSEEVCSVTPNASVSCTRITLSLWYFYYLHGENISGYQTSHRRCLLAVRLALLKLVEIGGFMTIQHRMVRFIPTPAPCPICPGWSKAMRQLGRNTLVLV